MRFDELKTIYARVHQADQTCCREYALSDRAAVQLTFDACAHNPVPRALLEHRIYDPDESRFPEIGDLSARELVKLAEIRSMVDAWVAGQLDELPPSTSTRIRDEDALMSKRRRSPSLPRM